MKRFAWTLLALAWAQPAWAQTTPNCEDDTNVGPNRVYIQAADTQVPILKVLGKQLRAQATPITIVYSPNGSFSNITYLYNAAFTPNATAGGTFLSRAIRISIPKPIPPRAIRCSTCSRNSSSAIARR